MTQPSKENPKMIQALKDGKAPLEYLVDSVMDGDAWVHKGGADKYGIRNWLIDEIKASTYIGALRRHLKKWSEGESIDPDSGWSHLYHIRAGCAIVLDAEKYGTLIDDRNLAESINDKQAAPRVGIPRRAGGIGPADDIALPGGSHAERLNSIYGRTTEHEIMGVRELPHCVRFCNDDNVTYKGPFPDWWRAQEYAQLNPHNIAGIRTLHTLNRP